MHGVPPYFLPKKQSTGLLLQRMQAKSLEKTKRVTGASRFFYTHRKNKTPHVGAWRGFFIDFYKDCLSSMRQYKRILMRLTMKNGLTVDTPVTKEISAAVGYAIRAVAIATVMYGVANLISAVVPLISALK
ncbi:hypothetical protein [Lelliottia wanjuensis]|uniref:hypothetical protein n=1 Tax=Lelliottia wanjuensis TaxID=3050585 RepID=UPI00254E3A98|nr:hypothetical protein [Lelliottia sp. V104_15]MDK9607126.1 hypothetical protein [Lelliottia sp. V104_15]